MESDNGGRGGGKMHNLDKNCPRMKGWIQILLKSSKFLVEVSNLNSNSNTWTWREILVQ
jgi:hypothetical protein